MITRRLLFRLVFSGLFMAKLSASEDNKLSPKDPEAFATGFTTDVTKVDTTRFPAQPPGRSCVTCTAFTKVSDGWGSCKTHSNKLVPVKGWCSAYKST